MLSALAPPPTSRKFAGFPPAWLTTSSVDMTSPAPLPMMPTSPSSFTYCSPFSLASACVGSTGNSARSSARSGWRYSALSSIGHLRVEGDDVPVRQQRERVDLDERRVVRHRTSYSLGSSADAPARASCGRCPVSQPDLEVLQPHQRIDLRAADRAGVVVRDVLDVHPAPRRHHRQVPARAAVERDGAVELAPDVDQLLDQHARDRRPVEPLAEHPLRCPAASSGDRTSAIPPPLPRPPICTCTLTATRPPSPLGGRARRIRGPATSDAGSAMPAAANSCFPWCS